MCPRVGGTPSPVQLPALRRYLERVAKDMGWSKEVAKHCKDWKEELRVSAQSTSPTRFGHHGMPEKLYRADKLPHCKIRYEVRTTLITFTIH